MRIAMHTISNKTTFKARQFTIQPTTRKEIENSNRPSRDITKKINKKYNCETCVYMFYRSTSMYVQPDYLPNRGKRERGKEMRIVVYMRPSSCFSFNGMRCKGCARNEQESQKTHTQKLHKVSLGLGFTQTSQANK